MPQFSNGNKVAKFGKKNAFGEYVVHLYVDGKRVKDASYHTTARDDAEMTAATMVGLEPSREGLARKAATFTGYEVHMTKEMTIQEYGAARDEILRKYRAGEWDATKAMNALAKLKVDFLRHIGPGDKTNPRKRAKRRLSLNEISRVHRRSGRAALGVRAPGHLKRIIRRVGRKMYGKTFGHRPRRNPAIPYYVGTKEDGSIVIVRTLHPTAQPWIAAYGPFATHDAAMNEMERLKGYVGYDEMERDRRGRYIKRINRSAHKRATRRNPREPRSVPNKLYYVQVYRRHHIMGSKLPPGWYDYATCATEETARRVALAVAKADRVPTRVTDTPGMR